METVCSENSKPVNYGGSSVCYEDVVIAIRWMVREFQEKNHGVALLNFWINRNYDNMKLSSVLLKCDYFGVPIEGNKYDYEDDKRTREAVHEMLRECEPGMRLVRLIYTCAHLYFAQHVSRINDDPDAFVDWETESGSNPPCPVFIPLPGKVMLKAAVLADFCVRMRDNKKTPHEELFSILFERTMPLGFQRMGEEYYEAWEQNKGGDSKNPLKCLPGMLVNKILNDPDYYDAPHYLLYMVQKELGFRYLDIIKLQEALTCQKSPLNPQWCSWGQLKGDREMKWENESTRKMICHISTLPFGVPDAPSDRKVPVITGKCVGKKDVEEMFAAYNESDVDQMKETLWFLQKCAKSFKSGKSHDSAVTLVCRLRELMAYIGDSVFSLCEADNVPKRKRIN